MKKATFAIDNCISFRLKMLSWANQFNIFCLLDNNGYDFNKAGFDCLLAAGCRESIQVNAGNAFRALKAFSAADKNWLFGHLGYDLKNEIYPLQSEKLDGIGFADANFFVPEIVVQLNNKEVTVYCAEPEEIFNIISSGNEFTVTASPRLNISSRFTKQDYITTVQKLRQHILRGDCYEINFCQEFFSENASIDPTSAYQKLSQISPSPFAALYKTGDKYCICASPERYIKKSGNKIIAQPMKGTGTRCVTDATKDLANKELLLSSAKERSENVMVVDLVRNDLSKICKTGTVSVDELFGIYSFPQVHQMISTVSGQLESSVHWTDVVQATFPMGSMTGAPKLRVMQLTEQYERSRRGLFSGAIGYINPTGDFDFNVIIRSIFYNAVTNYVSFQTGSAITFYSDAAAEYEECLLKAAALKKVLE